MFKNKSKINIRKLFSTRIKRVVVIAAVALMGAITLVFAKATSILSISLEAETGSPSRAALVIGDSSASDGKAIKFSANTAQPNGGCQFGGLPAPCIGSVTTGANNWGPLVFYDEFNSAQLDLNKWTECFFPLAFAWGETPEICGVMNDSTTLKANVFMQNGSVVLRQSSVIENSDKDNGALINTDPYQINGKLPRTTDKGFMMGVNQYAEARVYIPGNGTNCYNWPAWWINGPESGYADGEIDIAEMGGTGRMTSNYHIDRGNGREVTQFTVPGYWCNDYHIYAVDRQVGLNIIYFDGKEVTRYPTYDNGAPMALMFNVGYKTGKTPMAGPASDVKIDYVRVWKKP